jgi:hypothetical protein
MSKLSNIKAKEVLDFLVQKHSPGHIDINDDYAVVKWNNVEIDSNGYITDNGMFNGTILLAQHPFRLLKQYEPGGTYVHWISCISYDRLLSYLLRASAAGMNVFVDKPVKTYLGWSIERVTFFPAYMTLEEMMIAKDLNENA